MREAIARSHGLKLLGNKLASAQPVQQQVAPGTHGWILKVQPYAVRSVFENMKFRRHSFFPQSEVKRNAVFGRNHCVAGRSEKESRRDLGRDVEFAGKFADEFWLGVLS